MKNLKYIFLGLALIAAQLAVGATETVISMNATGSQVKLGNSVTIYTDVVVEDGTCSSYAVGANDVAWDWFSTVKTTRKGFFSIKNDYTKCKLRISQVSPVTTGQTLVDGISNWTTKELPAGGSLVVEIPSGSEWRIQGKLTGCTQ